MDSNLLFEFKIVAGKTDKDIKDPDTDIQNADWLAWYTDIQIKMQKVIEENKKVEDDIKRRQDRYIKREMDYRQNIEELQAQLRIRLDNGDSSDEDELEGEDPQGERIKRKYQPVINKLKKQFLDSVEDIDPRVEQMGQEQQKDIIRKFNSEMIKMKKKLEDQKSFKGD